MDGNTVLTSLPSSSSIITNTSFEEVDSLHQKHGSSINESKISDVTSLKETEYKTPHGKSKQRKVLEALILFLTGFVVAFSSCMIGPSLLDLEVLTNSDTAKVGMIFTARGVGSLAGYIICGAIIDKLNHWLLVSLANLLGAVFIILTPMCRNITTLILCSVPSGFMEGFLDAACLTILLMIWGKDNGPWMQSYTFLYGIGCMISPLAVEPFLMKQAEPRLINTTSESCLNFSALTACNISTGSMQESHNRGIAESKLIYAFAISSILKSLTFVASLVVCATGDRIFVPKKKDADNESDKKEYNFATTSWIAFLVSLFFFSATAVALEISMGSYLMTFSVKYLKWTKFNGAAVTFLYQGSYTLGCALGIFVIKNLRPSMVIIIDLSICIVFSAMMASLISVHDIVLWVSASGIGLGVSTIYATTFTWTERLIGVNARVGSIILVGCGLGDMAFPTITGALMDKVNLVIFVYIMLYFAVSGMVVFVILIRMAHMSKKCNVNAELSD